MNAIKAVGVGGAEVLTMVDVEMPVPGPREVLVKVDLAAVNFADINTRRGTYRTDNSTREAIDLGLEIYGHVVGFGIGANLFELGQRVAGFSRSGAYAEYAVANEQLVWAIPDGVSDDQAAAFPTVGQTAFHLLTSTARMRKGESVMITAAAGGVGSTVVQIARLLGSGPIIGIVGSSQGISLAKRVGVDLAIDHSEQSLEVAMNGWAGANTVDIVLDGVGGDLRKQALRSVSPFGRMVQFGNSSGMAEELPPLRELRERVVGVFGFHLNFMRVNRRMELKKSADQLLEWLLGGQFNIIIDDILPLSCAAEAHSRIENRQVRGKLLLSTARSL